LLLVKDIVAARRIEIRPLFSDEHRIPEFCEIRTTVMSQTNNKNLTLTSSEIGDYIILLTCRIEEVRLSVKILDVVKRNPLFFHSISCKNNEFLFTIFNIYYFLPNIYSPHLEDAPLQRDISLP